MAAKRKVWWEKGNLRRNELKQRKINGNGCGSVEIWQYVFFSSQNFGRVEHLRKLIFELAFGGYSVCSSQSHAQFDNVARKFIISLFQSEPN